VSVLRQCAAPDRPDQLDQPPSRSAVPVAPFLSARARVAARCPRATTTDSAPCLSPCRTAAWRRACASCG
jgi:hypothetical protein